MLSDRRIIVRLSAGFLQNVQTGCGSYPCSFSVGMGGCFPRGGSAWAWNRSLTPCLVLPVFLLWVHREKLVWPCVAVELYMMSHKTWYHREKSCGSVLCSQNVFIASAIVIEPQILSIQSEVIRRVVLRVVLVGASMMSFCSRAVL